MKSQKQFPEECLGRAKEAAQRPIVPRRESAIASTPPTLREFMEIIMSMRRSGQAYRPGTTKYSPEDKAAKKRHHEKIAKIAEDLPQLYDARGRMVPWDDIVNDWELRDKWLDNARRFLDEPTDSLLIPLVLAEGDRKDLRDKGYSEEVIEAAIASEKGTYDYITDLEISSES